MAKKATKTAPAAKKAASKAKAPAKAPTKKAAKEPAKATAKPTAKPAQKAPEKPAEKAVTTKAIKTVQSDETQQAVKEASKKSTLLRAVPSEPEVKPEVVEPPPKKEKAVKISKAAKAASEEEARWVELYEKHKSEKALPYDMKASFSAGHALQHKVLGWGWIMGVENDRLDVLFKEGRKVLISNYNPSR